MNFYEEIQKDNKVCILLLIVTIIVFSPVFTGTEFLTYDDDWYIYENENVKNLSLLSLRNIFTTLQGGQYSPLAEIYHSIIYYVFGRNPMAFKLFGFLIHLINVLLLLRVLCKIFSDRVLILFVSLIFAIHPLQVETIGWISVIFRNAVFFMLCGYLFYFKYLESNRQLLKLLPVVLLYVLAFLTKEQAMLFPVGIFLIRMYKSEFKFSKGLFLEMLFWFILALLMGLITVEITKTGGPSIVDRNIPLFNKSLFLFKTIADYFSNFLFPLNLSFSYPYPIDDEIPSLYSIFLGIFIFVFCLYLSLEDKKFRFGFLWAFGFLCLGLAFAFFHLRDSYMADRYLYLSIIGFAIMFYQLFTLIKKKISFNLGYLLILYLLFCSYKSFMRVLVFKNSKDLWTQAILVNPKNPYAYNSLGFYYRNQNSLDTAKTLYKKSIQLNPNYFLAHNNIAKVYFEEKEYDSAFYHVSKAISLNPYFENAYENRAYLYYVTNQKEKYLKDLNKLLEFSPENERYLISRAKFFFREKDYEKSLEDALQTIKYNKTEDGSLFYIIGHSYLILKRPKEAENYLSRAIDLDNKKSKYYFSRSIVRTSQKKWELALKDALRAKQLGHKINRVYLALLQKEVAKKK